MKNNIDKGLNQLAVALVLSAILVVGTGFIFQQDKQKTSASNKEIKTPIANELFLIVQNSTGISR